MSMPMALSEAVARAARERSEQERETLGLETEFRAPGAAEPGS